MPVADKVVKAVRNPRVFKKHHLSPQLSGVLGVSEATRQEALKGIWDYIKKNNLQDPGNKKVVQNDNTLTNLFGKPTVTVPEVMKLMSKHINKPIDS